MAFDLSSSNDLQDDITAQAFAIRFEQSPSIPMKLKVIALLFLAVSPLFAQSSGGARSTTSSNAGAPSPTTCSGTNSYYVNTTNGDFYDCPSGTWVKAGNGGGAGTGTVTVVSSGNLTSTALVTGGGTQTLQTPSATSTLDSSGNMTLPGTVDLINNPFTALPTTAAAGHTRLATVSNREVFSTNARVGGMFYPPNTPGVALRPMLHPETGHGMVVHRFASCEPLQRRFPFAPPSHFPR